MAATILTQSVSRNEHFHPSTTFATAERLAAVIGRAPNENHTRYKFWNAITIQSIALIPDWLGVRFRVR